MQHTYSVLHTNLMSVKFVLAAFPLILAMQSGPTLAYSAHGTYEKVTTWTAPAGSNKMVMLQLSLNDADNPPVTIFENIGHFEISLEFLGWSSFPNFVLSIRDPLHSSGLIQKPVRYDLSPSSITGHRLVRIYIGEHFMWFEASDAPDTYFYPGPGELSDFGGPLTRVKNFPIMFGVGHQGLVTLTSTFAGNAPRDALYEYTPSPLANKSVPLLSELIDNEWSKTGPFVGATGLQYVIAKPNVAVGILISAIL